jgi:geranylgeranyl pyrophosphate synthase
MQWGKEVTPEVSQNIARFKSAQYSFMYPLQYGLQLSGRDIHQLDTYSDAAGLAFQMRDDWLDISEDIGSGKDKNLDDKNSVPNIVQNLLNENDNDIIHTKKIVENHLYEYKTRATASLQQLDLSDRQRSSLLKVLEFSTSI